jgi:hypothetical protein
MPSKFIWCDGQFGQCNSATQYGSITVYYENLDDAGVITMKKAGSIDTSAADIQNFGSGTTTYVSKVGLFNFSFSNMGQQTFYNGNGTDAAGGVILQKGWTLKNLTLGTYQEENPIAYNMQPVSGS